MEKVIMAVGLVVFFSCQPQQKQTTESTISKEVQMKKVSFTSEGLETFTTPRVLTPQNPILPL